MRVRLPSLLAAAALAAAPAACSSFDFLTDVESSPPSAADCGGCHVEIYDEFRSSAHAEAWVRPDFVAATADHRIEDCLGCHAPATIYTDGAPTARAARREEGVTCLSCHFDGGSMVGPVASSALVDPHPVAVARDIYRSSELCGKCHEGTYREWLAAPEDGRRTCQDCHMGRVTRKATQATSAVSKVLVSFEDEFEGRRHTFHVPLDGTIDDALAVTLHGVHRDEETLRCDLALTNELPHLMPTGDFGYRWVKITTEARSPSGSLLATEETSLFKELGQALAPGETRTFPSSFPPGTSSIRVVVTTGKRSGPRATILDRTLETP